MRVTKYQIFTTALLMLFLSVRAQNPDASDIISITQYVEDHQECLSNNVIYDGCNLLLNSDGEFLFGQLNILHPELQMRILMQGVTFYIDPTGKKKEKYAIIFPSGSSVEDTMSKMTPPNYEQQLSTDTPPDISPLISILSNEGAKYSVNSKATAVSNNRSLISLDDSTHCLSYSFLLPLENLLSEKKLQENWTIGIYSEGGEPQRGEAGIGAPGMRGPNQERLNPGGPGRGRPNGNPLPGNTQKNNKQEGDNDSKVDEALRKKMMKDIEDWTSFSFSQICSLDQ